MMTKIIIKAKSFIYFIFRHCKFDFLENIFNIFLRFVSHVTKPYLYKIKQNLFIWDRIIIFIALGDRY